MFQKSIPQSPRALSVGSCDLPILYKDASWMGVFFSVELSVATAFLKDSGVEPWPIFGRAVAAIYAWEYRDSTVGSYNEVGLGIQCRKPGTNPSLIKLGFDMLAQPNQGIWVASLPVTTIEACRAGVEIWGYPKYVTNIETRFDQKEGQVKLADELQLNVSGPTFLKKNIPIATYSKLGNQIQRTSISVKTDVKLCTSGQLKLLSENGQTGQCAAQLRLNKSKVLGSFLANQFEAVLPIGETLI
jgi:hypothetical protein